MSHSRSSIVSELPTKMALVPLRHRACSVIVAVRAADFGWQDVRFSLTIHGFKTLNRKRAKERARQREEPQVGSLINPRRVSENIQELLACICV